MICQHWTNVISFIKQYNLIYLFDKLNFKNDFSCILIPFDRADKFNN